MPEFVKVDYNARTEEFQQLLSDGKSREEIAELYGLANWKAVDTHMRRRGYAWDSINKCYYLKDSSEFKDLLANAPAKVAMVINQFDKDDSDPKAIAKIVGLKDHKELADYMTKNGYAWSSDRSNYVFASGKIEDASDDSEDCGQVVDSFTKSTNEVQKIPLSADIRHYIPLLEMLEKNKERLIDLLAVAIDGKVPHYAVGGVQKTKSIYMSSSLSDLVNTFCSSKNVSQKQVVEAALVEYLKKYGFKKEVEMLLKRG